MDNICVISFGFPNEVEPAKLVFVRKLVWEWVDTGKKVTVIAPISALSRTLSEIPKKIIEKTPKGSEYWIHRPRYIPIPRGKFLFLNSQRLFLHTRLMACKRAIREGNIKADCFYGHFISPAGLCASELGRFFSKPSYIAYGESTDWSIKRHTYRFLCRALSYVNGIVAVSTKNREKIIEKKLCEANKTGLFLNGVNTEHYYPRDKQSSRALFGLDNNRFIVAFIGSFIDRKGILHLNEAVSKIDEAGAIFAGSGSLTPTGDHVLYKGVVTPEDIPMFLSAADVFVLPTKNEGCSNAILEALACGLPIISSKLPFNYDILDGRCSILVNPENVNEIKDAILSLKNSPELREQLARGSLEKAKTLSLSKRAEDILAFMDEMSTRGNR